jgi:hypothetical protein
MRDSGNDELLQYNFFDFNNEGPSYFAREAVAAALKIIADRKVASAISQLAALRAARELMFLLAHAKGYGKKTVAALETIASTILEAEKSLRVIAEKERKKEKKKGGRRFGGATLIQRMAAKLAADWLTELTPPLSIENATRAVATCVPEGLVTMPSALEQVREWRDQYGREKKGAEKKRSRRHQNWGSYKRALALVEDHRSTLFKRQSKTGDWLASPLDVISWLEGYFRESDIDE